MTTVELAEHLGVPVIDILRLLTRRPRLVKLSYRDGPTRAWPPEAVAAIARALFPVRVARAAARVTSPR